MPRNCNCLKATITASLLAVALPSHGQELEPRLTVLGRTVAIVNFPGVGGTSGNDFDEVSSIETISALLGKVNIGSSIGENNSFENDFTTASLSSALDWSDNDRGFIADGIAIHFVDHQVSRFDEREPTNSTIESSVNVTIRSENSPTPFSLRYDLFSQATGGTASPARSTVQFLNVDTNQFVVSANSDSSVSTSGYVEGDLESGDDYKILAQAFGSSNNSPFADYDSSASWGLTFLIGQGSNQNNALGPSGPPPSPPSTPILTSIIPESVTGPVFMIEDPDPFFFDDVESGRWYDPVASTGFVYQMEDGALFTQIIDFADGFDNPFEVWAEGQSLGTFGEDESVDFLNILGHGVSAFAVTGISPTVDGDDPFAFPIQIEFDSETADFSQWALTTVPEPSSLALLAFGGIALMRRRRS